MPRRIFREAERINQRRRRRRRRPVGHEEPVGPRLKVRRKRPWRKSQAVSGWITLLVGAAMVLFFLRMLLRTFPPVS